MALIELTTDEDSFSPLIPDGSLHYYSRFFSRSEANTLFEQLLTSIPWQQDQITVFGKTYNQPRLTSLHAKESTTYTYSNLQLQSHPFTTELLNILERIHRKCDYTFNSVLLNQYRDGSDSNGWHADNEPELGKNPPIASISLGGERYFHFKHRTLANQRYKIKLGHGSLLIMGGEFQHHWVHQIPKTKKKVEQRINLTYRKLN